MCLINDITITNFLNELQQFFIKLFWHSIRVAGFSFLPVTLEPTR